MPGETKETVDEDFVKDDIDNSKEDNDSTTDHSTPTTRGEILDFSSCDLSTLSLPQKDYQSTTELNLDYNNLTTLPNDICTSLPQLKKLSVLGNDLKELPDKIGLLSMLQEIQASENELACLPDSLKDLRDLETLDLIGNKLTELIPEIGCLHKLQRLDLEENNLCSLPESFGSLKSLEVFEACSNCIRSLPNSIGQLGKLQVLNLSNNKLVSLPESFGNLPNLRWVDLSTNKIEDLPERFDSAPTLERLYMIGNLVKSIPEWIGNLPKLKDLSFRDNQLVHKPFTEEFGSVSGQLESFDFSGNSIKELPSTLGNLKRLKTLHFGSVIGELERRNYQNGNWIPHLPASFGQLQSLKELRADENQLMELPENFGQLVNLTFVDLGQNMIEVLPASFTHLRSLKVCKLSKNHLQCLPEDFGSLMSLEDLRLDSNQLSALPTSIEDLTALTTLDLYANQFKAVPPCLNKLKKLTRLDLDENDFDLPYTELPYVYQDNKYPVRDATNKASWRGRVRADNVMLKADSFPKFDNKAQPDKKTPTVMSDTLLQAMQNNRSIWESHEGSTANRGRPKTQTNGALSKNENKQAAELMSALLGDTGEAEEDGEDSNVLVGRRAARSQFHYTSSEGSESDCASNISVDDDKRKVSLSSEGRSSSPLSAISPSDVLEEDWDEELTDTQPYEISNVYQHPAMEQRFKFNTGPNFEYIPSCEHVPSISAENNIPDAEIGQFDDAFDDA